MITVTVRVAPWCALAGWMERRSAAGAARFALGSATERLVTTDGRPLAGSAARSYRRRFGTVR